MTEVLYKITEFILPFGWAKYDFMKNALFAVILITPIFALLGTTVISRHMAFFSDVLGHSALTGVAIGVILGLKDPTVSMVLFAVLLAVAVTFFKSATKAASDTVIGVFFAMMVALGIVILSRSGGFARYTTYLIGDILSVTPGKIFVLVVMHQIDVKFIFILFLTNIIIVPILDHY